jgi:hypothetical protein
MHQFEERDSDCVSPRIPSTVRNMSRRMLPHNRRVGSLGLSLGSAPLECGSVEVGLSVGVGSCIYYLNCWATDRGRVSYSLS